MEPLPLHVQRVEKLSAFINRSHALVHSTALLAMFYHRISSFLHPSAFDKRVPPPPLLPWLLVFSSELCLAFLWLLSTAFGWRPLSRTVYPERLPPDNELPGIDVLICTADPKTEPPLEVMNTVISAMALDYPPGKLSVYLSDDGGSNLTLFAIKEAWNFAKSWVVFCRRYKIKTRCPRAYFEAIHNNNNNNNENDNDDEFKQDRTKLENEYCLFKERLIFATEKEEVKNKINDERGGRPPTIQIISERVTHSSSEMPFLVYISREKRPAYPHHFKSGALNVMLRVSATMSNAPYLLILDCDMYSNDPSSARQAMCFHLDPKISPSLAFVQFPQEFHNIAKNNIYSGDLVSFFQIQCPGMDGLRGPMLSGTGFYLKRKALYGSEAEKGKDLLLLRDSFGASNEFLKSLDGHFHLVGNEGSVDTLIKEAKLLTSCVYEKDTQWGKQIGFLYDSVVEDYFTGMVLRCRGWTSVYCKPSRPAFLGSVPTNLGDTLVQGTRWCSGLFEVFLSRMCPFVYGLPRMPLLDCVCFAYFAMISLSCFPALCLAVVPQLCLLKSIPLYPNASSPWFAVYSFVFLSSLAKNLWDVVSSGGTVRAWWNGWRLWMIKTVTSYLYGVLDAVLKLLGLAKASFVPTNKVVDDEQVKRYQNDVFDFQASAVLFAPLVTLTILNMVTLVWGVGLSILAGLSKEFFAQIFLSLFIVVTSYPIVEGMLFRRDVGRVPPQVTLLSAAFSLAILCLSSLCFA